MILLSRRALLAAALAAPALLPTDALAAIRAPLKETPERLKPLGVWGLKDPKIEIEIGDTATIELYFRCAIDVETPVFRWWVTRLAPITPAKRPKECIPATGQNTTVLDPLSTGTVAPVSFDLAVPAPPPKPNNVLRGEIRSDIQRARLVGKRKRAYRAFVEMGDPSTCRRATFNFNVYVLDDYPN